MWIPKTAEEIEHVLTSRELRETPSFDGKREIPGSRELAVDVAAMATDGGVLLIGVAEDEHGVLSVSAPTELAGARERIDQIIATNISEPPRVVIHSIECTSDPSRGYLVIAVPQSERAPHMVTTKGHNRYYGRGETGNRVLTEGEVARLYERRSHFEVNRDLLLEKEIRESPLAASDELGYLHMFVRPTAPDEQLLGRAIRVLDTAEANPRQALTSLLGEAGQSEILPFTEQGYPKFSDQLGWYRVETGYRHRGPSEQHYRRYTEAQYGVLEILIDEDGTGHLVSGYAAGRREHRGKNILAVFEVNIVAHAVRFLWMMGRLYEAAGYWGSVDVGLAVTGIQDSVSGHILSHYNRYWVVGEPYRKAEYRRTRRFSQSEILMGTIEAARAITAPLFETLTQGRYDPFDDMLSGRAPV